MERSGLHVSGGGLRVGRPVFKRDARNSTSWSSFWIEAESVTQPASSPCLLMLYALRGTFPQRCGATPREKPKSR